MGLENIGLEIVVNAAAVQIFDPLDKELGDLLKQMQELANNNVKIIVCRNALRANTIYEEGLPAFVTVVPAGITRIITKQTEGYAYVKP